MSCLGIGFTNDFFMYATNQNTKIYFTCLITTFYVHVYILNSLQTVA